MMLFPFKHCSRQDNVGLIIHTFKVIVVRVFDIIVLLGDETSTAVNVQPAKMINQQYTDAWSCLVLLLLLTFCVSGWYFSTLVVNCVKKKNVTILLMITMIIIKTTIIIMRIIMN